MRPISGTDCALSHLEMDWRLTSIFSASSSCDQPFFFLCSMILSASIMLKKLPSFRMSQVYPKSRLHAIKGGWNFRNRRLQNARKALVRGA